MDAFSSIGAGPDSMVDARRLMAEAREARSRHLVRLLRAIGDEACPDGPAARARAAELLERHLGSIGSLDDGGTRFVSRVATLLQISSDVIGGMRTRISNLDLSPVGTLAISTVLVDVVRFVEGSATDRDAISMLVAAGREASRTVLGVAVDGVQGPVGRWSASVALRRAAALARAVGWEFGRGVDGARAVFGVVVPRAGRLPPGGRAERSDGG